VPKIFDIHLAFWYIVKSGAATGQLVIHVRSFKITQQMLHIEVLFQGFILNPVKP